MIFVTVGSRSHGFDRLVKEIDRIAPKLREKILAQINGTRYKPKNILFFDFCSRKKLLEYIKRSNLVITHGGVGNIFSALNFGKPVIAVPRFKKYKEHINDHQLKISRVLEKQGLIYAVYDIKDLYKKIKLALKDRPKVFLDRVPRKMLIKKLKEYLFSLENLNN